MFKKWKEQYLSLKKDELKNEFNLKYADLKQSLSVKELRIKEKLDEIDSKQAELDIKINSFKNVEKQSQLEHEERLANFKKEFDSMNNDFIKKKSEIEEKTNKLTEDLNDHIRILEEKKIKLEYDERDIEDLQKRVLQKKDDLSRENSRLKDQIRNIESKASPSGVWASAFSSGFNMGFKMAYDSTTNIDNRRINNIRQRAIDETLKRMEPKQNGN